MFARRFAAHLVGREGRGWLKIVGATGFMFLFGIVVGLYAIGRSDGLEGAAAAGVLTITVLLSTVFGAIAGTLLVARDVVKLQLDEGRHVSLLLRLVLASGIVSLLIWVVGAFGGAIVLTILLIYLDTGSLSGRGNVAANTPVSGNNMLPVTPDPSIPDFDTPPLDRPIPSPVVPPVIPPVLPTGGTPASIDEPEQPPDSDDPAATPSEPPAAEFIEPLIIGSEVPAKEAYAQFVERYGAERVARVVVRLTSESPAAEVRLRGELMRQVAVGTVPSIYVSAQKTTLAGIVAPVDALTTLTDDFEFGEVTQVRENDRIVMVTFAEEVAASIGRPTVGQPETSAEEPAANGDDPLAQLVAQFDGGDLRSRREAADAIAALNTPQAAKALAERLSGTDRLAVSQALESMGEVAHAAVLAQAESEDLATSSAAFGILRETGTKKLLPKLQRLARHRDQHIASQAKLAIAAIGRQR